MQAVAAEQIVILGDVRRTITDTADGMAGDLIVMRTRGHIGPARAVLGSGADPVMAGFR